MISSAGGITATAVKMSVLQGKKGIFGTFVGLYGSVAGAAVGINRMNDAATLRGLHLTPNLVPSPKMPSATVQSKKYFVPSSLEDTELNTNIFTKMIDFIYSSLPNSLQNLITSRVSPNLATANEMEILFSQNNLNVLMLCYLIGMIVFSMLMV